MDVTTSSGNPVKLMTIMPHNIDVKNNPSRVICSDVCNSMHDALVSLKRIAADDNFGRAGDPSFEHDYQITYTKIIVGVHVNTWTTNEFEHHQAYGTEIVIAHN